MRFFHEKTKVETGSCLKTQSRLVRGKKKKETEEEANQPERKKKGSCTAADVDSGFDWLSKPFYTLAYAGSKPFVLSTF